MTEENILLYEKKGPIAFFIFNRPDQMNAMSQEMCDALEEAVPDARLGQSPAQLACLLPQPGTPLQPPPRRRGLVRGLQPIAALHVALEKPPDAEPAGQLEPGVGPGEFHPAGDLAKRPVQALVHGRDRGHRLEARTGAQK